MALNALKGVNIAGRYCDMEIFTSVRPNTKCINCQNLDTSIINAKVKRNAAYVRKTMKHAIMNAQHANQKLLVHTSSSNARIATRIINPMMKIVKCVYR